MWVHECISVQDWRNDEAGQGLSGMMLLVDPSDPARCLDGLSLSDPPFSAINRPNNDEQAPVDDSALCQFLFSFINFDMYSQIIFNATIVY